ncbi:MAG TPA: CapA family protein [Jatrophihabitans sp.]|nr:CapA family protein [Jatrophihabitans sp.]
MPATHRPRLIAVLGLAGALALPACQAHRADGSSTRSASSGTTSHSASTSAAGTPTSPAKPAAPTEPAGQFTIAFAGDVHFTGRTAQRLAADPATAFGASAPVLARADLTMVNLETAIAVGGRPEIKSYTFQAPPSAFTALADAGVDVVTMANNHGADYGAAGLSQTLAAIRRSGFPVVGIGANAAAAYAPYYRTVNGVRIAIVAASQVQDETLAHFSATDTSAGIANAYSDRLIAAVRTARAHVDVVIAYLHWGTEYQSCPNRDQEALADALAAAGANAIIGTHAHVLQGAGWRPDGRYVAYGLGNYFWWKSFGNDQDDNGVLTLHFVDGRVQAATFIPSQLDDQGVSPPATGANAQRIDAEFARVRQCTGLSATPPPR